MWIGMQHLTFIILCKWQITKVIRIAFALADLNNPLKRTLWVAFANQSSLLFSQKSFMASANLQWLMLPAFGA